MMYVTNDWEYFPIYGPIAHINGYGLSSSYSVGV